MLPKKEVKLLFNFFPTENNSVGLIGHGIITMGTPFYLLHSKGIPFPYRFPNHDHIPQPPIYKLSQFQLILRWTLDRKKLNKPLHSASRHRVKIFAL